MAELCVYLYHFSVFSDLFIYVLVVCVKVITFEDQRCCNCIAVRFTSKVESLNTASDNVYSIQFYIITF